MDARIKLSAPCLADRVAWEGSILSTLDYGVRSGDIADPELAELWRELETLYDQMTPILGQVDLRIRRARAA